MCAMFLCFVVVDGCCCCCCCCVVFVDFGGNSHSLARLRPAPVQVINKLGLSQVPLFGFQYTDSKGAETFLKLDKKVCGCGVWVWVGLLLSHRTGSFPPAFAPPHTHAQILSQDVNKKELPIPLHFAAKFFPESVQEELTHEGIQVCRNCPA